MSLGVWVRSLHRDRETALIQARERLCDVARRFRLPVSDGEDIKSEALLRAIRLAGSLHGDEVVPFTRWLGSILAYVRKETLRAGRKDTRLLGPDSLPWILQEESDSHRVPGIADDLARLVDELPPPSREICIFLLMRPGDLEGVVAWLNCWRPELRSSSLRKQVRRAFLRLQTCIVGFDAPRDLWPGAFTHRNPWKRIPPPPLEPNEGGCM